MIRLLLLLTLALLQVGPPPVVQETSFSRYQRTIHGPAIGQTCVILDAATFAHGEPFLKDLRLYAGGPGALHEIPYVLTLSEAQQAESEAARVLNLGTRGHAVEFDLAMPNRPYTEVVFDLAGQDFVATASITGSSSPNSAQPTRLGDFTLFDLTSQHLSRSTSLHLQESSFPYLHVTLTASPAGGGSFVATPQMVRGASIPPSREAQTLFTTAAQTSTFTQRGRKTVARFNLPQRVPIERVTFSVIPSYHANFSRDVVVSSHAPGTAVSSGETASGRIQRVNLTRAGREISQQQLSVAATLGANLQQSAEVEVAVDNGDDPPLAIAAIQLEMRQHNLCFENPGAEPQTLFYGDAELPAAQYDLARTFTPSAHPSLTQLGPEALNPRFRSRPDARPFTERHPQLLWTALLCAVCALALVAFRSSRSRLHPHH